MKTATIGLTLAIASVIASSSVYANDGKTRRAYDVCVNANTDAVLTHFPPQIGDQLTVAGMILPAGTVPSNGTGDATCISYAASKIGTFFVSGTFVGDFSAQFLPQAAADDLAYVNWHFRLNDLGAFDTTGPVKRFVPGGTYPQTITGGTREFRGVKGELTVQQLGAGGFQFRAFLPEKD